MAKFGLYGLLTCLPRGFGSTSWRTINRIRYWLLNVAVNTLITVNVIRMPHRPDLLKLCQSVIVLTIAAVVIGCTATTDKPASDAQRNLQAGRTGVALTTTALQDPPRAMARRALDNPAFTWDSTATTGVTVYFQPGRYAAPHADRLLAGAEESLQHALALLDESAFPHHLRMFYVESREEMAQLTGQERGSTGLADFESATVYVVLNAEKPRGADRHEIMHSVSIMRWGQPAGARTLEEWLPGGWLREGLATYADNQCGPATVREISHAMYEAGDIIPVDSLATAFLRQNDLYAYIQAGSIMEYLIETYGVEQYRAFWEGGNASFADVYGLSMAALQSDWHLWLSKTSPNPFVDLDLLNEEGC